MDWPSIYSDFSWHQASDSLATALQHPTTTISPVDVSSTSTKPVEIVCNGLTSLSYISLCLRSFQGLSPIYISAPLGIHDFNDHLLRGTNCSDTNTHHVFEVLHRSLRHMTFAYGMSACKSCTFYSRLFFFLFICKLRRIRMGKSVVLVLRTTAALPRQYGLHSTYAHSTTVNMESTYVVMRRTTRRAIHLLHLFPTSQPTVRHVGRKCGRTRI